MGVRDSRRQRLGRLLLEPRLQLRYAVHFLIFGALATGFTMWVGYRAATTVVRRILEQAGHDGILTDIVHESIGVALLQSAWIFPIVAAFGIFYSAALFDRFIGPQVTIRRHIRRLSEGDYDGECRVREDDELRDLVDDLNDLTERLRGLAPHEAREPGAVTSRKGPGLKLV
jgi:hypothetical protein